MLWPVWYSSQQLHENKAKKVAYCSSLPHFSFSSMQKVVGEAILPNIFSKISQLHLSKKTTFLVKLNCIK